MLIKFRGGGELDLEYIPDVGFGRQFVYTRLPSKPRFLMNLRFLRIEEIKFIIQGCSSVRPKILFTFHSILLLLYTEDNKSILMAVLWEKLRGKSNSYQYITEKHIWALADYSVSGAIADWAMTISVKMMNWNSVHILDVPSR